MSLCLNDSLWRTVNEPDIDPLMADAICSNSLFRDWWVYKFIPDICFERIINAEPNFTREAESASHQSKPGRETDLHVVIQDKMGLHHAILIENKIDAPQGPDQLDDYLKYAQWGKDRGRWKTAVTVLMAPEGYLTKSTLNPDIEVISYEEIAERANSYGCQELSEYLFAGLKRYQYTGEPRNPDDTVSSFRIKYAGLLRDEYPKLYELLISKGKELFDGSQKWFYFRLNDKTEIVHKISNNKGEQDDDDKQYLSLHIPGLGTYTSVLPDLGMVGGWRLAKSNSKNKSAIYDIPMDDDARMYFKSFDTSAALRVWRLATELHNKYEKQHDEIKRSKLSSHLESAFLNLITTSMPEIARFFGIIIRMFYDEHNPPHFHAEYSGNKAVFDFEGNVLKGSLSSKTATRLVREWTDLHVQELEEDWKLARKNMTIKKIEPLT